MTERTRGSPGERPALPAGRTAKRDWAEVRRRLEESEEAFARSLDVTPERKASILKSRAKALAREPEAEVAGEKVEVVEFSVAHERYAVESALVREVHPLEDLTPVPGTPPFILGVVSVRGRMVSVVDIKRLFDLPDRGLTELDRIVIIYEGEMELGILADAVMGTRSLPVESIRPALPSLTGIRAEYLKGVTDERLVVLDAARLLADTSLVVDDRAEA